MFLWPVGNVNFIYLMFSPAGVSDLCFGKFQGPLFQQRPYPSPGAVLRKNAEIASQSKKPNSRYAPITKRGDGSDGLGDAD